MLSVLDLFRIGIGPSSSHTLGPIRIGKRFLEELKQQSGLGAVARVVVELQGSLALTGKGHATPKASILGLFGFDPAPLERGSHQQESPAPAFADPRCGQNPAADWSAPCGVSQ